MENPAQAELVRAMRRLNDQLEHFEVADRDLAEETLLRMGRVYGRLQTANSVGISLTTSVTRGIDDGISMQWVEPEDRVAADVSGGEVAEDAVRG